MNVSNSTYASELRQQLRLAYPWCDNSVLHSCDVKQVQQQQTNGSCGLFSIATAVEFAVGNDPVVNYVSFDETSMRHHLALCFEAGEIKPFPKRSTSETSSCSHSSTGYHEEVSHVSTTTSNMNEWTTTISVASEQ